MIPYKLRKWIPECSICFKALSLNPRAIHLLEQNKDKISWELLSSNPEAISILEDNIVNIDWSVLSSNPAAIQLLEKNPGRIDWYRLSSNVAAFHILEKNIDKIIWSELSRNRNPDALNLFKISYFTLFTTNWYALCQNPKAMSFIEMEWDSTKTLNWFYKWFCCDSCNTKCLIRWTALCANTNPEAIRILEDNPDKIDWSALSSNPAATRLLEKNQEKIVWSNLSSNPDPGAIHLLENEIRTNPHNRISWALLSKNYGAIRILEKYPERIDWFKINENPNPEAIRILEAHWKAHAHIPWYILSENPNIFTYDYEEMTKTKNRLHEELIRNMFHPFNINKFEGWGFPIGLENEDDDN